MPVEIRKACAKDAPAMAGLLNRIIAIGGTTAYRGQFDVDRINAECFDPTFGICCFVAADGPHILGFQFLKRSDPDWPGDDRLPADWGIIATFVDPQTQQKGVGRQLFPRTSAAAAASGVNWIDATIRRENTGGQRYYHRLGFTDYRQTEQTVSKRFAVNSHRV